MTELLDGRIIGVMSRVGEQLEAYIKAGMTDGQARALCGLQPKEEPKSVELRTAADYEEGLKYAVHEALEALRKVLLTGKSDAAIVSAANAVLDRAKGKPVQTNIVNKHSTYTIVSAIENPPNSLVAGGKKGLPVIDVMESEDE